MISRLFALGLSLICALPVAAQSFKPVVYVNDEVITQFELNQRIQLLTVLSGGISRSAALEALIDERLQREATERAGFVASEEGIAAALEAFAARGNLTLEQLTALLAEQGVSQETLRDYVGPTLAWRELARARFISRAQVSEDEIDRALESNGQSGGLRVRMAEIFLPARDDAELAQSEEIASRFDEGTSLQNFGDLARQYSVAPTAPNGGRLDWVAIGDLPPALRTQVLGMKPGDVTAQLRTNNAIGYFQLLSVAEIPTPTPKASAIEYAAYYIDGGQSDKAYAQASKVEANIDTCEDLYGIAKGAPEGALEIGTLPVSDIPNDVALELAKLDVNEVSTALTRSNGEKLVFLMLCGRSYAASETEDREAVRQQLQSARIGSLAANFLAELKAEATILYP